MLLRRLLSLCLSFLVHAFRKHQENLLEGFSGLLMESFCVALLAGFYEGELEGLWRDSQEVRSEAF